MELEVRAGTVEDAFDTLVCFHLKDDGRSGGDVLMDADEDPVVDVGRLDRKMRL